MKHRLHRVTRSLPIRWLVRLVRWVLEPIRFLILRVVGDFGGGIYSIAVAFGVLPNVTTNQLLYGSWLLFVGVTTLLSEVVAVRERKAVMRKGSSS